MTDNFKYIILILLSFFLQGCSSPKFYNEIKSTYPKKQKDDAKLNISFSPHKLILENLSENMERTNHIIFHYAPNPDWLSREFRGLIYDVENNKYYYISNKEEEPQKIRIDTIYNNPDDNYYKFIIDNYQEGRIDYLKKLGELSDHSGYRTSEVIYEINLNSGLKRREIFDDFWFINGKPTMDIED